MDKIETRMSWPNRVASLTMLSRIVKRHCLIEMRFGSRHLTGD